MTGLNILAALCKSSNGGPNWRSICQKATRIVSVRKPKAGLGGGLVAPSHQLGSGGECNFLACHLYVWKNFID